jgi:hypothetical protein
LTVPFTARSPIEPSGKRIGLTTKLSVVGARFGHFPIVGLCSTCAKRDC